MLSEGGHKTPGFNTSSKIHEPSTTENEWNIVTKLCKDEYLGDSWPKSLEADKDKHFVSKKLKCR